MNNSWIKWPVFLMLCFIWGSSFILMKVSREGLTGMQIGALRIFSAGLVCIPFAIKHQQDFSRRKMALLTITGLCGNLMPAFLFALAIFRIDSSLAGILNSLTPICVVGTGVWVFRDKFAKNKIWGVLIGFAGLCILTLAQGEIEWGNLGFASLVLLATIFYGFNVNIISHHLKNFPPLSIASVSLTLMVIPSGIVLWLTGFFTLNFNDAMVQWAVINTVILGIVSSAIATALFYLLVQKAGGLFASLVTYGIPFVALLWGFIDGEQITLITMFSLLVILVGVYLANKR